MKNYLAVDIGGSKVQVGVVSEDGRILNTARKTYPVPYTKMQLVDDIKKLIDELEPENLAAGGITVPGLADTEKGVWLSSPFVGITSWSLTDDFSKTYNIPFFAENDGNACAVAEHMFGACRDTGDFMWITLSSGVGGAIYLGGKLLRGKHFGAGEIGHVIVEDDGMRCCCGNHGCLETAASGRGISSYYSSLTGRKTDAKQIAMLARQNDRSAIATYERAGKYLGRAISFAANILNMDRFILGGGIAIDNDLFLDIAEKEAQEHVLHTAIPEIDIRYTDLGYNAALLGCAAIAIENTK